MTDPRTMLDTYAAGISGMGTTEQAAPEAIAALRAVLDEADAMVNRANHLLLNHGDETVAGVLSQRARTVRRAITTALGGDQ